MIKREVTRLKVKYQTDDPFELCDELRIQIALEPMGTNLRSCKGFFLVNARCKIIVINSQLPDHIQRIILTHELGHAVLHSHSTGISAFHEFSVLDNADRYEYEANIFAAEFILEDEDVLDLLRDENDFFCLASHLNVPPELLDFKFRIMKQSGYQINIPITSHGDFLKRDISQPLS